MAGGLFALLDDISALARVAAASIDDVAAGAAKASSKTIGVIVDDAAVTPQYVSGLSPKRELPIIWKITKGSLRNKLLIILPVVLILSQFLPWVLPWLLVVGGSYLCFEGAEKVIEKLSKKQHGTEAPVATTNDADTEDTIVRNATTTDLVLSAEIMVIALNEVIDQPFFQRLFILILVAFLITALVYGVVALIVKADDVGLAMSQNGSGFSQTVGKGLLKGMPYVMATLTIVGTIAMLWVGGHILIAQLHEIGWNWPYETLHHITEPVHEAIGGAAAWAVDTMISAVVGLVWGSIIAGIVHLLPFSHKNDESHVDENAN